MGKLVFRRKKIWVFFLRIFFSEFFFKNFFQEFFSQEFFVLKFFFQEFFGNFFSEIFFGNIIFGNGFAPWSQTSVYDRALGLGLLPTWGNMLVQNSSSMSTV